MDEIGDLIPGGDHLRQRRQQRIHESVIAARAARNPAAAALEMAASNMLDIGGRLKQAIDSSGAAGGESLDFWAAAAPAVDRLVQSYRLGAALFALGARLEEDGWPVSRRESEQIAN
jgi:hypothetical protein